MPFWFLFDSSFPKSNQIPCFILIKNMRCMHPSSTWNVRSSYSWHDLVVQYFKHSPLSTPRSLLQTLVCMMSPTEPARRWIKEQRSDAFDASSRPLVFWDKTCTKFRGPSTAPMSRLIWIFICRQIGSPGCLHIWMACGAYSDVLNITLWIAIVESSMLTKVRITNDSVTR